MSSDTPLPMRFYIYDSCKSVYLDLDFVSGFLMNIKKYL